MLGDLISRLEPEDPSLATRASLLPAMLELHRVMEGSPMRRMQSSRRTWMLVLVLFFSSDIVRAQGAVVSDLSATRTIEGHVIAVEDQERHLSLDGWIDLRIEDHSFVTCYGPDYSISIKRIPVRGGRYAMEVPEHSTLEVKEIRLGARVLELPLDFRIEEDARDIELPFAENVRVEVPSLRIDQSIEVYEENEDPGERWGSWQRADEPEWLRSPFPHDGVGGSFREESLPLELSVASRSSREFWIRAEGRSWTRLRIRRGKASIRMAQWRFPLVSILGR